METASGFGEVATSSKQADFAEIGLNGMGAGFRAKTAWAKARFDKSIMRRAAFFKIGQR